MRLTFVLYAVLTDLLLLSSNAAAGTRYVNGALATGNNDGTSWADAYRGVDAVAVALTASNSGDEIWVAAGTYKPTTTTARTVWHQLKTGVAVYGGFNGTETTLSERDYQANVTILSGDIGTAGVNTDNSLHVVQAGGLDATSVLDGFTVTEGNADETTFPSDSRGGGIAVSGAGPNASGPTLRNMRFLANRSTDSGGAASVQGGAPTFVNVVFENNVSGMFGGAVSVYSSAPTMDRCTFIGNTSASGSALYSLLANQQSGVRIMNSLFRDNAATGSGGGAAIWTGGSFMSIRNCTIVENSSATSETAGIFVSSGYPLVANCVVWNNSGPGGAQGVMNQVAGTATVLYSIVEGGITGTGNLNVNPGFANASANDFSLTIASPAIDAGNNGSLVAGFTLDLAGRPRLAEEPTVVDTGAGVAPIVDIGAFEFQAPLVTSICNGDGTATSCPCGNDAQISSGTGCLNSLGTGGLLAPAGSARILSDTFVMMGSGMPNSSCLYFQGTAHVNGGNGMPFGDGILCAGGSVTRLGTKTNSVGASQYPMAGDLSISASGLVTAVGSARTYQCWYRNAAAFCTVETFNLTNGLSVIWEL